MKIENKLLSFSDFTKFSHIFIETGTSAGEGVNQALKAGFAIIKSVEMQPELYEIALSRFGNLEGVDLYLGDSKVMLPEMLEDFSGVAVFWLDSHPSGPDTGGHDDLMEKGARSEFTQDNILTKELEVIVNHNPSHVILIDDQYGPNPENARYIETLLKANPKYKFFFYDRQEGPTLYKDKVLACIPS